MPRTNPAHSATTATASQPTAHTVADHGDEREDVFFRRLSESRGAEATNGLHWSDLPMQFGLALKCAHIDHCLLGLQGVLEMLHAVRRPARRVNLAWVASSPIACCTPRVRWLSREKNRSMRCKRVLRLRQSEVSRRPAIVCSLRRR